MCDMKSALLSSMTRHVAVMLILVSGTLANVHSEGGQDVSLEKSEVKSGQKIDAREDKIFDRGRWRLRSDVIKDRAKAYYEQGENYGVSGRYEEAIAALKDAIKLKPDYADAYFGLGHAYSDLGRWKESLEAYTQVIRLKPKDTEARKNLDIAGAKLNLNKSAIAQQAQSNAPSQINNHAAGEEKVSRVVKASASSPSIASVALPTKNDATPVPIASVSKGNTENRMSAANGAVIVRDLTGFYRVGAGDVLDIRLLNDSTAKQSTLYTVMESGLIEYPLAGEPFSVVGLTSDEIASRLAANSKLRAVYDQPRIAVSVREYDSHSIIVSGLVDEPGTKVLRREAIPLYVVIADAQPRPDARRALVTSRFTGLNTTVDLADHAAMNMLVHPGDVIKAEGQPKGQLPPRQFLYLGGLVNAPGEKEFHPGMTLTQAILSAGDVRSIGMSVKTLKQAMLSDGLVGAHQSWYAATVARQEANGLLTTTKYKLEEIVSGKVPDPFLQPGDRIKVVR